MRSSYPRVAMVRLRLSWTRWLQTRKLKRLVREQHRLELLQRLMQEQSVVVGRLILDQQQLQQERQMFLETVPVEEMLPEPPPSQPEPPTPEPPEPKPLFRGTPETMPDPMQDLAQRLGLPPQQS